MFLMIAIVSEVFAQSVEKTQVPLSDVIEAVKHELAVVQNTPGPSIKLDLVSVVIAMTVTSEEQANGKVSIGVPLFGGDLGVGVESSELRQSIVTVKLKPPRPSPLMSNLKALPFGIASAIIDFRKQLADGLNGEPRLIPQSVNYEIYFAVERRGGPEGKLSFHVFSANMGATWSSSQTSRITLMFQKSKTP